MWAGFFCSKPKAAPTTTELVDAAVPQTPRPSSIGTPTAELADAAGPTTPRPSPRGRARGQLTALHEAEPVPQANDSFKESYCLPDDDGPAREQEPQTRVNGDVPPRFSQDSARSADSVSPKPTSAQVSRIGTLDNGIGNSTPSSRLGTSPLGELVLDSDQMMGERADGSTASGTEGVGSSKPSSTPSHGRFDVEGIVAGAPQAAAERPDFSGSWQCVRVEGDTPGFLQDMGTTPIQREAARRARYGANIQIQSITQDGDTFTVMDQLKTTNTMKFQVGLGPQRSCDLEGKPVIITPTWDGQTLCVVTETEAGILWASSRRFFEEDEMVLELSSPEGFKSRRIFNRRGGSRHSGLMSSMRSTRLDSGSRPSSVT